MSYRRLLTMKLNGWVVLKNAAAQLKEFTGLYNKSIKNEMTLEIWEKAVEIYVQLISKGRPIGKDVRNRIFLQRRSA